MWRSLILAWALWAAPAWALQVNGDLAAVAAEAKRLNVPVLVVFGASDCVYCRRLERDVLEPMLKLPPRERGVLVVEVHIDDDAPLVWLDGGRTSGVALGERFGVEFTPTVVLFSPAGEPLSRPLVGYNPQFYESYLEAAIEDARARLQASG